MMRFSQILSTNVYQYDSATAGTSAWKKPHYIATLKFSKIVNNHSNYIIYYTIYNSQVGKTFFDETKRKLRD